jgi:alpha-beta hydrolase superfamily lysophospholipase
MTIDPESNYILSGDGIKLNYKISNVDDAIAVVCLLHGHGEHSGRYSHVIEHLNNKGISCVSFDFRGHGISEGKRGHIPSIEVVLNDVEESLKLVRLNHLDIPMFLFGHSFGGCVVLNYVLRKPITELKGFISSSPWLALAFEPPSWKVKLGEFMASTLPRFTLASELDPNHLSKDEPVGIDYVADALVHNKISAGFFSEVSKSGKYALENANNVKLPGLVYHGNADKVIDFESSKLFASKSENVEFKEFDGVYHEPHNDLEKEEVLNTLSSWILKAVK